MNSFAPFAPIITLSVGSLLYLLIGGFLERMKMAGVVALLLLAASAVVVAGLQVGPLAMEFGFLITPFTKALGVLACMAAFVSILAAFSTVAREGVRALSDYYFLLLSSVSGALVMIFASDFLTLFIGLEVTSLALYTLCAVRDEKRTSSESALKYFLLGCFSSAFFLYGIALWYGSTGTLDLQSAPDATISSIQVLSFLMMLIGIAFKLGLAPFHFWVPDVYQGSPISVTTFMSCVVKIAAVGALLKIAFITFHLPSEWALGVLWVLAVTAMTIGNLAALQQRSVKRMLAYSSVSHAGYMLIGVVVSQQGDGSAIGALLYYLVTYCAMSIGAFAVLGAIGPDADDIQDLKGLSKRSPFLALSMTVFFLALAGLPPSLAGLFGKAFLFTSALSAEFYGLAIIAALNSALACAYYFRVPVAIFFQSGDSESKVLVPLTAGVAIALCVGAVVGLGLYPERVFEVTEDAATSLVPERHEG